MQRKLAISVEFRAEYGRLIKESMLFDPVSKLEDETYEHFTSKPLWIIDEKDNVEEVKKEVPLCEKALWKKYRRLVWKITEKQNLRKLPNYEKRAFHGYHLDHKVSIWYGYKNKLNPKLIGGIDNLEFIPSKENMRKGRKCDFSRNPNLQVGMFLVTE